MGDVGRNICVLPHIRVFWVMSIMTIIEKIFFEPSFEQIIVLYICCDVVVKC
jgi:hypothetical protein